MPPICCLGCSHLQNKDMPSFHSNGPPAPLPTAPKCFILICMVCLSLLIKPHTTTRPTTFDMAVPLIKVLIELNGCGNEQMSSIKIKSQIAQLTKELSIIITFKYMQLSTNIVNCYRAIYDNWLHNRRSGSLAAF